MANTRYQNRPHLLVVEVNADSLDAPIRVEDSYGTGTARPHVYGSIPAGAAVALHPLRRTGDGAWSFSVDDEIDAASTDR